MTIEFDNNLSSKKIDGTLFLDESTPWAHYLSFSRTRYLSCLIIHHQIGSTKTRSDFQKGLKQKLNGLTMTDSILVNVT